MKNKILINVFVLCLYEEYEIYIPVNESVKEVCSLIVDSIYTLSDARISKDDKYCLLDFDTNTIYNYSLLIRDTNIVNGKKIILL